MKKLISLILLTGVVSLISSCGTLLKVLTKKVNVEASDSKPISHDKWTALLQKHVRQGKLDYQGIIEDSTTLDEYLGELSAGLPNDKNWSREEQFAYWINAYNAFTVKLIIDNYPIKSIKDIKGGVSFINSVWDMKFITIENQEFDLNDIEHGILRDKFGDPRIHFAINCASISCPALYNEAFVGEDLENQLNKVTEAFFTDPTKNQFSANEAKISKIFKWFKPDFTKDQSLKEFLNKYSPTPITKDTKVSNLDYDWNLNDITD